MTSLGFTYKKNLEDQFIQIDLNNSVVTYGTMLGMRYRYLSKLDIFEQRNLFHLLMYRYK